MVLLIRGNVVQSLTQYNAVPDGNVASPGLSFAHASTTGVSRSAEGNVVISVGGTAAMEVSTEGITANAFVGDGAGLSNIAAANVTGLTAALDVIDASSVSSNVVYGDASGDLQIGANLVPTSNVAFNLGTELLRFKDLFLSGNTIDLGGSLIQSVLGNVVIQNLDVGTIRGDGSQLTGLSQPMTLSGIQITDDNWVSIDDTALTSNVSGYCVVTGTNFAPGSIVTVGGTNASATSYASSTQLRVQAPSKASGSYTLSVIRSGDGASVSLPSAVTYSEGITWITTSNLGTVDGGTPFSIPIQATSDSNVSYANITSLPPTTTLNPTTGELAGNISGVTDTTFSFDVQASDLEFQDSVRSFILRCLGIWVSQIVSYEHTLALSNRGQLVGWGRNDYGQTGVGNTTTPVTLPVDITDKGSLTGRMITAVASGLVHNAALTSDGVVHCWGYNGDGRCGQNNTTSPQLVPVVVGGALAGQTVTSVACGLTHALALVGGVVYSWGGNTNGQIGNNSTTDVLTPVAITGGSLSGKTVVQIRGGYYTSMALASDGTVHMWGSRAQGQIPGGASGNQTTPVDVSGFGALAGKTPVDIQAGYYHCLVLCSDNSVISWGINSSGEVGIGNTTSPQNTPLNITTNGSLASKTVSSIFIGALSFTSFAIASDESIHAWGYGYYGTIGDGAGAQRNSPVDISSSLGAGISRLGGGRHSVFALRDDVGTVSAWGYNLHYGLGDGTTTTQMTPVDVTTNIMALFLLPIRGGTVTTNGGYAYHTLTSDGTLSVSKSCTVDILVVGGGGGGGKNRACGGGGGHVNHIVGVSLQQGTTVTVTVGGGGEGGRNTHYPGYAGEASTFAITGGTTYTAPGGGLGQSDGDSFGPTVGGSSGKNVLGVVTTFNGGGYSNYTGGGGAGANTDGSSPGNGGDGLNVWGTYYGGGGGGGLDGYGTNVPVKLGGLGGGGSGAPWNSGTAGVSGTNGLGGGGGGGSGKNGVLGGLGGNGGSGVVIVRYLSG